MQKLRYNSEDCAESYAVADYHKSMLGFCQTLASAGVTMVSGVSRVESACFGRASMDAWCGLVSLSPGSASPAREIPYFVTGLRPLRLHFSDFLCLQESLNFTGTWGHFRRMFKMEHSESVVPHQNETRLAIREQVPALLREVPFQPGYQHPRRHTQQGRTRIHTVKSWRSLLRLCGGPLLGEGKTGLVCTLS